MRLTREGYEKKLLHIKELQEKLHRTSTDSFSSIRESLDNENRVTTEAIALYNSIIAREIMELESAEIIKDSELDLGENICTVGDQVTFLMQHGSSTPMEVTKTLTDIPKVGSDVVSIDSPVGKALFQKEIGSVSEVKTPAGIINIYIISKINGRGTR